MTLVDQLLETLALVATTRAPAVSGRVTDQVGVPLVGATVRILASGMFSGSRHGSATTNARGEFSVGGAGALTAYIVEVEASGIVQHQFENRPPPLDLGEVRVTLPLRLSASVGDGGDNRAYDVARVQDRLRRLGRLSEPDVAAEPVALGVPGPVVPGPRLMAAIATHLAACFGRCPPIVRIDRTGPTADAIASDPPFPLARFAGAAPVGDLPGRDAGAPLNRASTVALVQERLHQLALVHGAARTAEIVDVNAADVDPATIPLTVSAIAAFDARVTGGSLRAIVPGSATERALNDPCYAGSRALALGGSVGANGLNRAADVRRLQDRLVDLGYLAPSDRDAEWPPLPSAGASATRVADANLAQTIAAIRAFRGARLGETAPVAGIVDPVDAALQRINRPARLELTDTVGWAPDVAAANRPADVRRLQERLLLLGFLAQADYDAERADPDASARVDQSGVQQTAVALALASQQRGTLSLVGSVGDGGANAPADVRAAQDRLHGLGFLSDTDYQSERIDPAAVVSVDPSTLAATFAAIAQLRRRIFECPAAAPDQPWTAHPIVEPGDETSGFLDDPLFYGRVPLTLEGSVGLFGWNFPASVRAVQERLRTMRLLSEDDFAAEVVDPFRASRVSDAEIVATRLAIGRLRESLLGEATPVVARLEVVSAAIGALEDRLGRVRVALEIADSVGWSGANAPADVALVQARLHALGFLGDADFDRESQVTPAPGEVRIGDAQIAETIAAIASFNLLMLGRSGEPRVEPFTELRSALAWPAIPCRVDLTLSGSVGRGGNNAPADVRTVQDRLFEVGLLERTDYFAERVDAAAAGAIADAALAQTIAAIGRLQQTWAAPAAQAPDFIVDPGGHASRVLADPAYATPTVPNPHCTVTAAGPARPLFGDANLMRIVKAIEAQEGGVSSGEVPAILRNASGVPASWGSAQVIGSTAIGMLNTAANAAFAVFYGLDAATLGRLQGVANAAGALFDQVAPLVAANTTEAALQTQIATYAAANRATVRANTGLGPSDIEHMFRAAQLRRHLVAAAAGGDPSVLFDARTHPDAAANIAALRLAPSDVAKYFANPDIEHRAGFVTRALLMAPEGQILRNLLTDDTGIKFGRNVIRDNWNQTPPGLPPRDRAQITAYMHNHGGNAAALAGQLAVVAADDYVTRVIARYDAL